MKQLVNLILIGVAFLMLGNISDYRSQFIRAMIYSKSLTEQRQDSAINICQALLTHDYAARYHAKEQQLEIQERQAKAERSHIFSLAAAVIALMAIGFAIYFFRQKRIVSSKNRALVRLINGLPPALLSGEDEEPYMNHGDSKPVNDDLLLFNDIEHAIRTERLYANINLQRQDIMNRFGISRHTLNDLMNRYANGLTFPQFINTIRLEEAKQMLDTQADTTLIVIAEAVGFTPANLREQFKRCYGMTPAEYRKEREEM
jgi:AraC-like DNA-binding protein